MREDGAYIQRLPEAEEPAFNVHKEFYNKNFGLVSETLLYDEWLSCATIRASATSDAAENPHSVPVDDEPNASDETAVAVDLGAEPEPEQEAALE